MSEAIVDVTALASWLPAESGPWHLDFERWPQAQALRWRAVLAAGAKGVPMLLADREPDLMLLQSLESRLQCPVRWLRVDAAALEHWLGAGEADFRALSGLEESLAQKGGINSVDDLSARSLSEQANPVMRLLDAGRGRGPGRGPRPASRGQTPSAVLMSRATAGTTPGV